ncbi:hypothetical protein [Aestuariispira ectoiniformans]|uniref:hypothetical protein n=1 Tax=Aestuariispira ectoiniformans TaxID=2775080 RepID=UPI00223A911D|nr:hypothetical protein [Aestuariispira ectoiniformans]
MADLWIFGRKPHGLVRYRHGGFNATFPMNTHTVTAQAVLREADMKREQEDAQAAPRPDMQRNNVISFADRRTRAGRAPSLRGGKRPGDGPNPY